MISYFTALVDGALDDILIVLLLLLCSSLLCILATDEAFGGILDKDIVPMLTSYIIIPSLCSFAVAFIVFALCSIQFVTQVYVVTIPLKDSAIHTFGDESFLMGLMGCEFYMLYNHKPQKNT